MAEANEQPESSQPAQQPHWLDEEVAYDPIPLDPWSFNETDCWSRRENDPWDLGSSTPNGGGEGEDDVPFDDSDVREPGSHEFLFGRRRHYDFGEPIG
jgi:hypothetical protein